MKERRELRGQFCGQNSWIYIVYAEILWFEYVNTAWELEIVHRKIAKQILYILVSGYKQSSFIGAREKYIRTYCPSFAGSLGQPAISTASPGTFAHSLGRLAFQTSAVEGGQTRLTGCHGDLMDWSEQISSPKTPERIAGFQRIASASVRWVSFRSSASFLLSFFLLQVSVPPYDSYPLRKKVWGNLDDRSLHHIIIVHSDCLFLV